MSLVTNVILSFLGLEEEKAQLVEVNKFFGNVKGLVCIEDEALPRGWYGGNSGFETSIAIGAFNYLDLNALVKHLKTLDWRWREDVQLLVKEDGESGFRIINVFEVNDD